SVIGNNQSPDPSRGDAVALTAPSQRAIPDLADGIPKRLQGRAVQGHPVVAEVSCHDRAQVGALFWDGIVQASPKLGLDLPELRLPPLAHRLPKHRELPCPGLRATVREAQEVEGLRPAPAALTPVRFGEATEFDQ